jgi:hypothetical protein
MNMRPRRVELSSKLYVSMESEDVELSETDEINRNIIIIIIIEIYLISSDYTIACEVVGGS